MRNLTNPTWIVAKGILFLILGLLALTLMLLKNWSVENAFLLSVSVWSFCRFYYFAFYVMERYVDSAYRFAGLWSLVRYVLSGRRGG
ncbi:MAG TPA: hypothetical protein VFO39_08130 [Candidatus Sulfotelmatobacter sp.]|nr:hypothetical protein [Candidatus Sulfotelmatobacter sp.]